MDRSQHCIGKCEAVKKLTDAQRAMEILLELKRHCDPILKARRWKVRGMRHLQAAACAIGREFGRAQVNKLFEICCCSRGGKNLSIGGFCVPAGDGATSLRIAIRLRRPRSHGLYPLDHLLQTMFHEIAHIVHSAHSADFYALMAELSDNHASFLSRGVVLDRDNMPMGPVGRVLDSARHNPRSAADARARGGAAAEARKRKADLTRGGGRLGSAVEAAGGGGWRARNPAAMAAAAAARLFGAQHGLDADELELVRDARAVSDADEASGTEEAAAVAWAAEAVAAAGAGAVEAKAETGKARSPKRQRRSPRHTPPRSPASDSAPAG